MEFERLLLEKRLITVRTGVIGILLMLLHMIVHRVLTLFDDAACGTDKRALLRTNVGEGFLLVFLIYRDCMDCMDCMGCNGYS